MPTIKREETSLWQGFKALDDTLKLRILLLAGREAAAALRIACGKDLHPAEIRLSEQAILYEPFTYWDWHRTDTAVSHTSHSVVTERQGQHYDGERRKRRLLWEREKGFQANNQWNAYPAPEERWIQFREAVMRKPTNRTLVKRIALASWMTDGDLQWIAQNLTRLEAIDFSDVPKTSDSVIHRNERWVSYLRHLKTVQPFFLDSDTFLEEFSYLQVSGMELYRIQETERLNNFYDNREHYNYRQLTPAAQIDPSMTEQSHKTETFEEFLWRNLSKQEDYEEKTGIERSDTLREFERKISESHLWRRLKWIGLRDWRSSGNHAIAVCMAIPNWCASLKTVSIRGEYEQDFTSRDESSVHRNVCQFILGISQFVPNTVEKLELRLSISFLGHLLKELYTWKPSIKRIGIDLGAWIQVFPLRSEQPKLKDDAIQQNAITIARQYSLEVYRNCRETDSPIRPEWLFPQSTNSEGQYQNGQIHLSKQSDFYRDRSGSSQDEVSANEMEDSAEMFSVHVPASDNLFHDYLHTGNCPIDLSTHHETTINLIAKTQADTLPKLLKKIHLSVFSSLESEVISTQAGEQEKKNGEGDDYNTFKRIIAARPGAKLFPLQAEPQQRSNDPIHPLTLIQVKNETGSECESDYQGFAPDMLQDVYPWLEETFRWRPVFDWDWFMTPDHVLSKVATNMPASDWFQNLSFEEFQNKFNSALSDISLQFEFLARAKIPVHILIGRRDPEVSSLYWGWPYHPDRWKEWQRVEFSTSFEAIAPHVNVLSIFYDLRNPLDQDRLSQIEGRDGHIAPRSQCPNRDCPWASTGNCPFKSRISDHKHPRPQVAGERKPFNLTRKQSQKRVASNTPKGSHRLANGCYSAPPPGINANDNSSDDSDPDSEGFRTSHQHARRAAYTREALGWQRFWKKYALQLKNLSVLRVRMPRAFDQVGSWRLAKLLNQDQGWGMIYYTDERQHCQTDEERKGIIDDVPENVYRKMKEGKVWPAGRFVRRTWVWDKLKMYKDHKNHLRFEERKKQVFSFRDELETMENEDKELGKSTESASKAMKLEAKALESKGIPPVPFQLENHVELDFRGVYGQHIRSVAGRQWREELREIANRISTVHPFDASAGELLEYTREVICSESYNRPPYNAIFRKTVEGEVQSDLQRPWKNNICLQQHHPIAPPEHSRGDGGSQISEGYQTNSDSHDDLYDQGRRSITPEIRIEDPVGNNPPRRLPFGSLSSSDEENEQIWPISRLPRTAAHTDVPLDRGSGLEITAASQEVVKETNTEDIVSKSPSNTLPDSVVSTLESSVTSTQDAPTVSTAAADQPVEQLELIQEPNVLLPKTAKPLELTPDMDLTSFSAIEDAPTPSEKPRTSQDKKKRAMKDIAFMPTYRSSSEEFEEEPIEQRAQTKPKPSSKRGASNASYVPLGEPLNGSGDEEEEEEKPKRGAKRAKIEKEGNTAETILPTKKRRMDVRMEEEAKSETGKTNSVAKAGTVDYEKMKAIDLRKMVSARGIPLKGLTKKAQYIEKLEEDDRRKSSER